MEQHRIDEKRIDAIFDGVERLRRSAWNLPVGEVAALSERVRVEIILDKSMSGPQKRWYRAFSDYLDAVVEERMEKENVERDKFHNWVLRYVRGLLESE